MARSPDQLLERIAAAPQALELAAELSLRAADGVDLSDYLAAALPRVARAAGAQRVALAALAEGSCRAIAESGPDGPVDPFPLPERLVADALDREARSDADGWSAAPLAPRAARGEVLVARGAAESCPLDSLAAALAAALEQVRQRAAQLRRVRRLETVLEIAQQWNRTQEMEPLLVQMAEAATQLLAADRASIFLWDRPHKTLVARPALGVEGGELKIADDVGVVGQVIRSGEPQRVDATEADAQIDHEVDRQVGYQTRNLLCVPLVSQSGEMLGAFEVLNRREGNFTSEDEAGLAELAAHAAIALENTQQRETLLATHQQIVDLAAEDVELIGESPALEALRSTVRRVADTDLAILILGENGTGKEVVSRSVHYLSSRRDQPIIAVNCAALTETLLESELFGHEKGAFTDAHEARQGKFELASGGTLFLDEIGDLSLGGQAKLLRALEEKVVVRVGGSTPIHTDARVLAATNQDLAAMVREKKFREDLFYRLNVVTLELPPLRDRGEDILLLADHFLTRFCHDAHRKVPKFTAAARKRLLRHPWPGNVRELRNLMERLAYLLTADRIDADDLDFILSPGGEGPGLVESDLPLSEATRRFQSEYIKQAIERARRNMSEAAERLGLHRSNLYRKMRQLGMGGEEDERRKDEG